MEEVKYTRRLDEIHDFISDDKDNNDSEGRKFEVSMSSS